MKISNNKEGALLKKGVSANKSTVALTNVTVSQAINAVVADNEFTTTISGGSFKAQKVTIGAQNSGTIILENAQITSSENTELYAKDGGAISMMGGTIKAVYNGAGFENSNSDKNKLENVTISSNKDGVLLKAGVSADKSTVALKDITVSEAESAVVTDNESTVTISGGSFDSSYAAICAQNGSSIILTDNTQITSHDEGGLYAEGAGSKITMTTGNVTGKSTALEADRGEHITVTNVTLKATNDGSGVAAGAATSGSN
uniref:NosD domain-containing protein n=1 Tax=Bartonella gabonensis TaxID=2699889 RepID=UPI003F6DED5C